MVVNSSYFTFRPIQKFWLFSCNRLLTLAFFGFFYLLFILQLEIGGISVSHKLGYLYYFLFFGNKESCDEIKRIDLQKLIS